MVLRAQQHAVKLDNKTAGGAQTKNPTLHKNSKERNKCAGSGAEEHKTDGDAPSEGGGIWQGLREAVPAPESPGESAAIAGAARAAPRRAPGAAPRGRDGATRQGAKAYAQLATHSTSACLIVPCL